MKYEFRIGDYAETKDGNRGYVIKSDLLCYQDIVTGYIITVKFSNEETMTYEFTANEAHRQFNRIGRYDFTEKEKSKIEPFQVNPALTEYASIFAISDKINELVDAVNELRMRDAKESKNG